MGSALKRRFISFAEKIDPSALAPIKRFTNELEARIAAGQGAVARPINLDPGYLTLAKLVLASTKDHAHRIYLSQGIYAEVTLSFRRGQWRHHDWTYPDYRRDDYHAFFTQCRDYFRRCVLRGNPP
jgi:hypothetical protein